MSALLLVLQPQVAAPQDPESQSDDIVVTGLRDLSDPDSLVTRQTLGSSRTGVGAIASRRAFEQSERFAKCALGRSAKSLQWLRAAIDGNINSARQSGAQQLYVKRNAACATDPLAARVGVATFTNGFDGSYYDRGAMYVEAIRLYAPDLRLTKAETGDSAVQARFNAREIPRARFRLPVDRRYFETAVCLVRVEPELSSRLIHMPSSHASIGRVEAAIVNRGRVCVGNARKVYFDPMQFRFYIVDALYRWTVAARGADSLLPE